MQHLSFEPEAGRSPVVFLDPWLSSRGHALAPIVESLVDDIARSGTQGITPTKRRDAVSRLRMCIGNVIGNLAYLHLSPNREPGHALAIATAKTKMTRYDRKDYPRRILAETLKALEQRGLLVRHEFAYKRLTTRITPTAAFEELMASREVRMADISRDPGGETIWLTARKPVEEMLGKRSPTLLVPYDDTDETQRLRTEIDAVSAFLNRAEITFKGDTLSTLALRRVYLLRSPHDAPTFALNGRLVGGMWMNLPSDLRHHLQIGGEEVADLDFTGCWVMLAYLLATGRLPPEEDPYDIPGLDRATSKLALLSLLARPSPMKLLAPDLKAGVPPRWTARDLVAAVERRHRPIAHLFGNDLGVALMNSESNLLMRLLAALETQGIASLPMHDGVMVGRSKAQATMETMRQVSAEMFGTALPVKEKPVWRPSVGGLLAA